MPVTAISRTATDPDIGLGSDLEVFKWLAIPNGDTGEPALFGHYADRSVQIGGTFGAGGAVAIKGTIDGTNFITLHDVFGNSLGAVTSVGIYQIAELVLQLRPEVTAGDGTTALNVYVLSRRPK